MHYNSGLMRVVAAADTLELTTSRLQQACATESEHPAVGRVRRRVNYLKHSLDAKLSAQLPTLDELNQALEVILARCEAIGLVPAKSNEGIG